MSASNNNIKQSPHAEMEAAAAKDAQPAKNECEFIVHTKHTCDDCFQQPILGKRYTSSVRSNFDLCARCFDAYSGPEIGLSESVLIRDKKHSSDFVLKLKIDNGGDVQVRRINVSEIWDKSLAQLSFAKMMYIASSYANPESISGNDSSLDDFIAKARVTYIDGDGDKITISSNEELKDSFLQVSKNFPLQKPFRITVSIGNDVSGVVRATKTAGKATNTAKCTKQRKLQPRAAKLLTAVAPKKFEKEFFIHARHTCDGCSKTPIIGTRYHATKIPDFDLCEACFEKYEGEDLDFKPQIHDRDRPMQQKWLKKYLGESLKMPTQIAGVWNKANGDIADFLKKVQESGGKIESATVYASPPCVAFVSDPELKKDDEKPPAKNADGLVAEPATVEAAGIERPPTPKTEEATAEQASRSPSASKAGPFLSDTDGIVSDSDPQEDDEKHSAKNTEEDVAEPTTVEAEGNECPPTPKTAETTAEQAPGSPSASKDDSFLSDADGNGSIAEAIGRTLDVCVQAMEEAMFDEIKEIEKLDDVGSKQESSEKPHDRKAALNEDVAFAAAASADAFSVASSMVSSMSDILKKMDDTKKMDVDKDTSDADDGASTIVPSMVTGATILKSEDGIDKRNHVEAPNVEDVSDGEDEWSVVSDNKTQVKLDEEIARAAEMDDSSFFSPVSGTKAKVLREDDKTDKSVSSVEPLSPVVLAKWDTELLQLHELGFLDDRLNVDVLERLEASHVGIGSTEKVTVQNAVEHLLA